MSVKFFVDTEGNYLGVFVGAAAPQIPHSEVPTAPEDSSQKWDFDLTEWSSIPIIAPESVTMRQARLALLGAGRLDDVEVAINNLPSPQKEAAKIEWDYSSMVYRNKPFVQSLGTQLGLDSEQLDQLFITASQID